MYILTIKNNYTPPHFIHKSFDLYRKTLFTKTSQKRVRVGRTKCVPTVIKATLPKIGNEYVTPMKYLTLRFSPGKICYEITFKVKAMSNESTNDKMPPRITCHSLLVQLSGSATL